MKKLRTFILNNKGTFWRSILMFPLLLLLVPDTLYHLPDQGLDNSWHIALHLAKVGNFVFGKDWVFTYGPLGILSTRLPFGGSLFSYVAFIIYIMGNWAYIFNYILKKDRRMTVFAVLLLLTNHIQNFYDRDVSLVLSCMCLFMIFNYLENRKLVVLVNALLLASLIFFIKLNLGIVIIFIVTIWLGYLFFSKVLPRNHIIIIVISFSLFLFISCQLLNVSFSNYFVGSLHLINAYNDAMFITVPITNSTLLDALSILLFFAILFFRHARSIVWGVNNLFIYFCIALICFVFFKNGFVRSHEDSFFYYMPLLMGLLYLYIKLEIKPAALALMLFSLFVGYLFPGNKGLIAANVFERRIDFMRNYSSQLRYINEDSVDLTTKKSVMIPNEILDSIGTGSVDILPTEISYIYYNHLKYNPRPVIQSYSAYDAYLDNLNAEKYRSSTAPDYLLMQHASIDNRNPLYDETKTKLAILENYEVINSSWDYLLLRKLRRPVKSSVYKTEYGKGEMSVPIRIEDSEGLQVLYTNVKYSFLGTLRRILFQPPSLFIKVILEDGSEYDYRAVTTLVKGGVIVNRLLPFTNDRADLELFVNHYGTLNSKVAYVKFYSDSPWGFKDNFDLKTEYLAFDKYRKSESKSTGSQFTEPLDIEVPLEKSGEISANFEEFGKSNRQLGISGWAFATHQKNRGSKIFVVLSSGTKTYVFPIKKIPRIDIPLVHKREDLDSTGFSMLISREFIEPGIYRFGLLFRDIPGGPILEYFNDKTFVLLDNKKYDLAEKNSWVEGGITFSLDNFEDQEMKIKINGWAFMNKFPNQRSTISLVAEGENFLKVFNSAPSQRPDVKQMFGRDDVEYSGFNVEFMKSQLAKGRYKMGILIQNKTTKKFQYVDKMITIE